MKEELIDFLEKVKEHSYGDYALNYLFQGADFHIRKLQKVNEEQPEYTEVFKDKVLSEYKKGKIVVASFDGIKSMPIEDFLNQPIDGILYDLNRDESTITTFLDDLKWVNDFALTKLVRELDKRLTELDNSRK